MCETLFISMCWPLWAHSRKAISNGSYRLSISARFAEHGVVIDPVEVEAMFVNEKKDKESRWKIKRSQKIIRRWKQRESGRQGGVGKEEVGR